MIALSAWIETIRKLSDIGILKTFLRTMIRIIVLMKINEKFYIIKNHLDKVSIMIKWGKRLEVKILMSLRKTTGQRSIEPLYIIKNLMSDIQSRMKEKRCKRVASYRILRMEYNTRQHLCWLELHLRSQRRSYQ